MPDTLKVVRRRLTFADRLKEYDEKIATASATLEKHRAGRAALVAEETQRIEAAQAALAAAKS